MFNSTKTSHLILRLGLAFVFLWFGIDKFVHPDYWINTWVPPWFNQILNGLGLGSLNFIYLNGIFEIILGSGFVLNIFVKLFAFLAALFLIFVILSFGLNEITVRDIGLLALALTLLFWNGRKKFSS